MDYNPYISFVVVARNDNYGGDFLHRINVFVKVLTTLCEGHGLQSELIIVEWNPPEESPRLINVILWPDIQRKYCRIRIIEVPNELHKILPNSNRLPLFEYIGKNVGVRRAQGEYILATNPDIIFSEELVNFLASEKLSPACFYRINRYDIKTPVPLDIPVKEQLEYFDKNIIRLHGYWYSYENRLSKRFNPYRRLRAFAGHLKQRFFYFPFVRPHINGSGDFFLMHRNHWKRLRGYQELNGAPHHIDSYTVNMAIFAGVKQVILKSPFRLYHQDHGRPENSKPFDADVELAYRQMAKEHKPIIFNNETWGFSKEALHEHYL